MQITELADVILENLQQRLEGKNLGMTTGYVELDNQVSRIQHGQLWTIGASTGIGKSYFILNMIHGMLKEKTDLRLAIFSTELSAENYLFRYACMRLGTYTLQVQRYPKDWMQKMTNELITITQERDTAPNSLDIYGDITSLEQIEGILKETHYDIVFIDYVQELSVIDNKRKLYDVKDTMPVIAKKLKAMALNLKTAIVAVSQVNNYALREDQKKSQIQPFSFGKELIQASTTAIYLQRVKRNGILDNVLIANVTKAREGVLGLSCFDIQSGYKLSIYDKETSIKYLEGNKNNL